MTLRPALMHPLPWDALVASPLTSIRATRRTTHHPRRPGC
jgi:hypothetical protein